MKKVLFVLTLLPCLIGNIGIVFTAYNWETFTFGVKILIYLFAVSNCYMLKLAIEKFNDDYDENPWSLKNRNLK